MNEKDDKRKIWKQNLNNSTNINTTTNLLSPQIIEHKKRPWHNKKFDIHVLTNFCGWINNIRRHICSNNGTATSVLTALTVFSLAKIHCHLCIWDVLISSINTVNTQKYIPSLNRIEVKKTYINSLITFFSNNYINIFLFFLISSEKINHIQTWTSFILKS